VTGKPATWFHGRYGASRPHLAGHLLALAIAAFAVDRVFSDGDLRVLVIWYLGFAIAHDLVFVPFYAALDHVMRKVLTRLSSPPGMGITVINHVRAPFLISGLLLLTYAPLILGLSDGAYFSLTGHHLEHYLRNWLLITAALFLGSGLIYALRVARLRRQQGTAMTVRSDVQVDAGE
jgi:hypothetical protein